MTNHKRRRAEHDRLCYIVADHMKRYDVVMVNQPFVAWGKTAGDHDVLGLKLDENNRVLSATSYEIKGRKSYKGRNKAIRQSLVKYEAMKELYLDAKINVLYVTQNHVERVR